MEAQHLSWDRLQDDDGNVKIHVPLLTPHGADLNSPAEIALETVSRGLARFIFGWWYFVLLVALVLQCVVDIQWKCTNICGATECNLHHFESWSSQDCANTENTNVTVSPRPMLQHYDDDDQGQWERWSGGNNSNGSTGDEYTNIVWHGGFASTFRSSLNRFVHLVFDCVTPTGTNKTIFQLDFGLVVEHVTDSSKEIKFLFTLPLSCPPGKSRCLPVVLPTTFSSANNQSRLIMTLFNPPSELLNESLHASVASIFQQSSYTIASAVVRYIAIVISLASTARFSYHLRQSKHPAMHEQMWVLALNVGLIIFANPLHVWGVLSVPEPGFLEFLEFRAPLYFIALLIAFMFSMITSSMNWTKRISHHPPILAKITAVLFVVIIIVIDLIEASRNDWDWAMEHCPNFKCGPFGFALYALMFLGVFVCSVWLRWLRNNLGAKPYLACRPQQLAFRLFAFIFSSYCVYWIISAIAMYYFLVDISEIVTYQNITQMGSVLVAASFVCILTYSFTATSREQRVPIHPTNPRWKQVRWPAKWFQWIAYHGGSMYIFFSEAEEKYFNFVQQQSQSSQFPSPPRYPDSLYSEPQLEDSSPPPVDGGHLLPKSKSFIEEVQEGVSKIFVAPGTMLDALETKMIDALPLPNRKPFFCLETAVDCFNLSWEAYGVPESAGDAPVETGININIPTCAPSVFSSCCGCGCCSSDEQSQLHHYSESNRQSTLADTSIVSAEMDSGIANASSVSRPVSVPYSASSMSGGGPTINVTQYGYKLISVQEANAVQLIICEMDTSVQRHLGKFPRFVIAFRGTNSRANVRQDLDFFRVEWSEMEATFWESKVQRTAPAVQQGFLDIWNALRDGVVTTVLDKVSREEFAEHRFVVTGHSLGGALAMLCAYTIHKRLRQCGHAYPQPIVYTFGSPRVGNASFAREYMKSVPSTFRVVNESDAISFLSIHGGSHTGVEIDVDRHGNFIVEPIYVEKMFRPTKGKGSSWRHHGMSGYATSLNAIAHNTGLGLCPSHCLIPYVTNQQHPELERGASIATSSQQAEPSTAAVAAAEAPTERREE